MRSVGIKVLKDKLSEHVRAATAGETVLVTDRGRVVAELVPPRPIARSDDEFVAMGIREGWLTSPSESGPLPAPLGLPSIPLKRLLADLDADREDR